MADEIKKVEEQRELSEEELTEQEIAELPDRDNMSLINANVAAPINLAAALNVASDNATAVAVANQTSPITQKTAESGRSNAPAFCCVRTAPTCHVYTRRRGSTAPEHGAGRRSSRS
jgi:hypothetical protein